MKANNTCPECGERKTVRIVYGHPTPATFALAKAGKIELGGCCEELGAPDRACPACGYQWNRETGTGKRKE